MKSADAVNSIMILGRGKRSAFFMCTARRLNIFFTSKAMSYTKNCHDIPTEEKWFLQCPPVHRGNWWCLKQL